MTLTPASTTLPGSWLRGHRPGDGAGRQAHGAERRAVRLPGRPVPRRVARHPGHHTARPPAFSGLAVSDATPELLDPVVRLLRLLDRPDDLRVLAPGLEREILWRLVTGDQGALVRQIGLASSSLTHISRAIRWIREHYNEPLLVADLAALSSMSASSFHRHFRAATSMTPIQFAKQIRLQEARALLMTQPAHVAEIGYLVGYESPSQFSREYRKTFGTPPGQDAARRGVPQHR
jgi:AraC-like DNA-binding protein